MHTDDFLHFVCDLIRFRSVTPDDAGCQERIRGRLEPLGFYCEDLSCGDVSNLWATHGNGNPVVVLAGHTDVVPPGPLTAWSQDPFEPTIRDNVLFGRGAADMKGGLAALIEAACTFVRSHPRHPGTLAFLITSDEEGPARDGTRHVVEVLKKREIRIDHCLIGEPSSCKQIGDTIRIGRRGSLSARLTVMGQQGHVAYPDQADNALHRLIPALSRLLEQHWASGDSNFPATSFQMSNISAGTGAYNVIPGQAAVQFNFRYPPPVTATQLKQQVTQILADLHLDYEIAWRESGKPFYSVPGPLREAVNHAIRSICGYQPEPSTGGGTSDGRFIAPMGAEVIELGTNRETIHKVDECVSLMELDTLVRIYHLTLERLLA